MSTRTTPGNMQLTSGPIKSLKRPRYRVFARSIVLKPTMSWNTTITRVFKKAPLVLIALSSYTIVVLYFYQRRIIHDKATITQLATATSSHKPWLFTTQARPAYNPTRIIEIIKTKIVTRIVYRTKPTADITHHAMQDDYIQFTDLDVATGNMTCDDEECSTWRLLTPRQAKLLCNVYDKCKGFTLTSSGEAYFKRDTKGTLVHHPGHTLFVKSRHVKELDKPMDMCAVQEDRNIVSDFTEGCKLAQFNPFDKNIMQFIKKPEPLHCNGQQQTRYRKGVIEYISGEKVKNAVYFPITRIPGKDWGFHIGKNISLDVTLKQNPVHHEFIRVETKTEDNKTHVDYHAAVVPKPDVLARPRVNTGLPLNVIMVGFDSLSRAHFERVFPEAFKFLRNDLKSVMMNGYTIVGDGTTPALTAFLTGQFEKELPEARRGFEGSAPVDRWPWIFKDYKSAGYATLFSEDCPGLAAFNYRLHGFNNTPTDHFSRYFWESASMTKPHCIHAKPQHLVHLHYIETFFEAYPDTPKLGVAFFTDSSHNNLNTIHIAVEDFTRFLNTLHQRNLLNDTLLIVFSDHGFRYGESRTTLQGHLEERLPLLSFSFPGWLEKTHPKVLANLRHNADLVTSPFDLHATLRHILTYPEVPEATSHSRGISMLQKIPKSRDCESAGVAEHYCPCLSIKTADTEHKHIKLSSEEVVEYINRKLSSDKISAALCHQLKLKKIVSGLQQMPNTKFQQFVGSADIHGRVPMFSKTKNELKECNYRIQIQTTPGDGLFEAPVRFKDDQFTVTGDISRINKYGEQPRCILDKRPDLRKYCLCKDYNNTSHGTDFTGH